MSPLRLVPLLLPLLALVPAPLHAQMQAQAQPRAANPGGATVQQILDGRQLYIDGKEAVVKQQARVPDAIKTLRSRGQLAFSGGAVGRINRFSSMKLGSSCFLLERGQILVSGPQNGCTRSARLSVRGTNYVMQVDAAGQSQVSVLEGTVELQALRDGVPLASVLPTLVRAGEQVQLNPEGVIRALGQLRRSDYEAVLSGPLFLGYQRALPYLPALIEHVMRVYPGLRLPPELLRQAATLAGLGGSRPKASVQAAPATPTAPKTPAAPAASAPTPF